MKFIDSLYRPWLHPISLMMAILWCLAVEIDYGLILGIIAGIVGYLVHCLIGAYSVLMIGADGAWKYD